MSRSAFSSARAARSACNALYAGRRLGRIACLLPRRFYTGQNNGTSATETSNVFRYTPTGTGTSKPTENNVIIASPDHAVDSTTGQPTQSSNPEGFYRHYLEKTKVRYDYWPAPGAWISRIDLEKNRAALPSALRDEPLKVFEDDTADVSLVQLALETFITMRHLSASSNDEARTSFVEAMAGTRALHWITGRFDQIDVGLQPRLLHYVTHCLVAERQDTYVRQWLSVEEPSSAMASLPDAERDHWRATTLYALAECKTFWTNDINEGLGAFLWAKRVAQTKGPYISLAVSGNWLLRQLLYVQHSHVHTSLYDRFSEVMWWKRDPSDREIAEAQLKMRHPSHPDPLPALRFIQKNEDADARPIFVRDLFDQKYGPVAASVYWFFIRTAQALNRHNYQSEARWVLDFGKKTSPEFFTWPVKNAKHRMPPDTPQPLRKSFLSTDENGILIRSDREKRIHESTNIFRGRD